MTNFIVTKMMWEVHNAEEYYHKAVNCEHPMHRMKFRELALNEIKNYEVLAGMFHELIADDDMKRNSTHMTSSTMHPDTAIPLKYIASHQFYEHFTNKVTKLKQDVMLVK